MKLARIDRSIKELHSIGVLNPIHQPKCFVNGWIGTLRDYETGKQQGQQRVPGLKTLRLSLDSRLATNSRGNPLLYPVDLLLLHATQEAKSKNDYRTQDASLDCQTTFLQTSNNHREHTNLKAR